MDSKKNSAVAEDDLKKRNTGSINTATNHTDSRGFTRPQHSTSGAEPSEPDSARGVTTATNHTNDSGVTSPGEDMSKKRAEKSGNPSL